MVNGPMWSYASTLASLIGSRLTYYLVIKLLYLTGRCGKGNKLVEHMFEIGMAPDVKFTMILLVFSVKWTS